MGTGTREAERLAAEQERGFESSIKHLRQDKDRLLRALKSESSTLQQTLISELMDERDKMGNALADILSEINDPDNDDAADLVVASIQRRAAGALS